MKQAKSPANCVPFAVHISAIAQYCPLELGVLYAQAPKLMVLPVAVTLFNPDAAIVVLFESRIVICHMYPSPIAKSVPIVVTELVVALALLV